jgi:hypothetical protein
MLTAWPGANLDAEVAAVAGEIFGIPVSMGNYSFAKRVASIFPRPWGAADVSPVEREQLVWESLVLHYEGFRRGIAVSEEELDTTVDELLRDLGQSFRRRRDAEAYRRWVKATLHEDVELFETQMRYLVQIRKLKDQMFERQRVTVSEEEMQREFLNDQHHLGGELVVFSTKAEAEVFYEDVKQPSRWDAMKARGTPPVRTFSPMTLTAIIDLWGVSREQARRCHAMSLGSVGPPMPFGKQWAVVRLLEKRTGDLRDFPKARVRYLRKVERTKKYQALTQWIETLKQAAHPVTFVHP